MTHTSILSNNPAIAAIRTVSIGDELWFVADETAHLLGLKASAVAQLLGPHQFAKAGLGDGRDVDVIAESGLYTLILNSNSAKARPFQDWVFRHVLPAIRQDQAYVVGEEKVAMSEEEEDEFIARAKEILERKIARLKCEKEAALAA